MIINFENEESLKREFKQKLHWFEEEFDLIFQNKIRNYTKEEIELANEILEKLSETINQYKDENLLYDLVKTLNNIEKKYPDFF